MYFHHMLEDWSCRKEATLKLQFSQKWFRPNHTIINMLGMGNNVYLLNIVF